MSEDDDKKLPAIQNRLISAAVEIDQDDPLDIVYQHSLFCQVALPRSRPEGRAFERGVLLSRKTVQKTTSRFCRI